MCLAVVRTSADGPDTWSVSVTVGKSEDIPASSGIREWLTQAQATSVFIFIAIGLNFPLVRATAKNGKRAKYRNLP